jgi:hypothetical protein
VANCPFALSKGTPRMALCDTEFLEAITLVDWAHSIGETRIKM